MQAISARLEAIKQWYATMDDTEDAWQRYGNVEHLAHLTRPLVAALQEALTALDKIGNTTDSAPTDVSGSGPCRIRLAESRNRRICEAKDALARIESIMGASNEA